MQIIFEVGEFCFWDAVGHSNDDKIKIHNALIWVLQDLSKYLHTTYKSYM